MFPEQVKGEINITHNALYSWICCIITDTSSVVEIDKNTLVTYRALRIKQNVTNSNVSVRYARTVIRS